MSVKMVVGFLRRRLAGITAGFAVGAVVSGGTPQQKQMNFKL